MPYPHTSLAGLYMYMNSDVFPLLRQPVNKILCVQPNKKKVFSDENLQQRSIVFKKNNRSQVLLRVRCNY